ncbi:Ubiquitin carboxyl-terminal hydrolase [Entamoeba marina]
MQEKNNWNTIESDPGVFNEMVKKLGVESISFQEIYSLEDMETFEKIKPVYGYIFLFEYNKNALQFIQNEYCAIDVNDYPDIFFAHQIVNNACATQAILSVLLNLTDVSIGDTLNNFKTESMKLTPHDRGIAIGNNKIIRDVHNEFAQPSEALEKKKFHHIIHLRVEKHITLLELFHIMVSYYFIGGAEDNWFTEGVKPFFNGIMSAMQGALEFTILAVTTDPLVKYQQLLNNATAENNEHLISLYKDILQDETTIREKQFKDNRRRKHDYMQLALNTLLLLGKHGELEPLVEKEVDLLTKK